MNRQMLFTEILLNPSVKTADEKRLSKQARKIYQLLRAGPAWTNQLCSVARQYNARIYELRQWLAPQGLTIDKIGKPDIYGNCRYEIVELNGSQYAKILSKRAGISPPAQRSALETPPVARIQATERRYTPQLDFRRPAARPAAERRNECYGSARPCFSHQTRQNASRFR